MAIIKRIKYISDIYFYIGIEYSEFYFYFEYR